MTRLTCVAIVLFASLALPPAVLAQEGTIEQLVATALERSPDIRAARTAVAAASGQLTQAGLRPNPTLTGSQLQMTGTQHQTLVGIEWPLDLFRGPHACRGNAGCRATSLSCRIGSGRSRRGT